MAEGHFIVLLLCGDIRNSLLFLYRAIVFYRAPALDGDAVPVRVTLRGTDVLSIAYYGLLYTSEQLYLG